MLIYSYVVKNKNRKTLNAFSSISPNICQLQIYISANISAKIKTYVSLFPLIKSNYLYF